MRAQAQIIIQDLIDAGTSVGGLTRRPAGVRRFGPNTGPIFDQMAGLAAQCIDKPRQRN
jgi:hypothetical protein